LQAANNIDPKTVQDFGRQWEKYNQRDLSRQEKCDLFQNYFRIFPAHHLHGTARGFDFGCGSCRFAALVAPEVKTLHCLDASPVALAVARHNLREFRNCRFHLVRSRGIPLPDGSMDFGFSLGVLHHLPRPQDGLVACVRKLKPGAPFLLYLYYNFDNQPLWYRNLWARSDRFRQRICRLPFAFKKTICWLVAAFIYLPVARVAALLEAFGCLPASFPLSFYRNLSFYTMKTDALDRLGTRVEHRFSRDAIRQMMLAAGLHRIRFSPQAPYWCAVGYRTSTPLPKYIPRRLPKRRGKGQKVSKKENRK